MGTFTFYLYWKGLYKYKRYHQYRDYIEANFFVISVDICVQHEPVPYRSGQSP